MNWRTTACILVLALATAVWSSWSRPLDLLPSPELNLDAYCQIEVLGDTGWSMSNEGDWRTTRPSRARLSNTRVEQWIRHFDRLESCFPPEDAPAHSIRFSKSLSGSPLDVPVWFDVVGPAKIQLDGRWYSVSSEVAEPIRFGLAPFRLSSRSAVFSPTAIRINLATGFHLVIRTSSWSIRKPLEAPADPELSKLGWKPWSRRRPQRFLGKCPRRRANCFQACFRWPQNSLWSVLSRCQLGPFDSGSVWPTALDSHKFEVKMSSLWLARKTLLSCCQVQPGSFFRPAPPFFRNVFTPLPSGTRRYAETRCQVNLTRLAHSCSTC